MNEIKEEFAYAPQFDTVVPKMALTRDANKN